MKAPHITRIPRTDLTSAVDAIESRLNRLLVETSAPQVMYFTNYDNLSSSFNWIVGSYQIPVPTNRTFQAMRVFIEDDGSGSGGTFMAILRTRKAASGSLAYKVFQITIDTSTSPGSTFYAEQTASSSPPHERLSRGDGWKLEVTSSSGTHRNITIVLEYTEHVPYTGRSAHVYGY